MSCGSTGGRGALRSRLRMRRSTTSRRRSRSPPRRGWWLRVRCACVMVALMLCAMGLGAESSGPQVRVDWKKVDAMSRTTPTLQVVVNPELRRGAKLHDGAFDALRELGADYVRYVP